MDYDDVIREAAKAMVAVSSDDPPRWEDAPPSIITTLETAMRAAAPILMEYGARLMREAAARKAYVECAVARHVRLGDACQIAIGGMDPATVVREAAK